MEDFSLDGRSKLSNVPKMLLDDFGKKAAGLRFSSSLNLSGVDQ